MSNRRGFVDYIKCIKNTLKQLSIYSLVFSLLFCGILILLNYDFTNNKVVYLLLFTSAYVLNLIVGITKIFYKRVYWFLFSTSSLIVFWNILSLLGVIKPDYAFSRNVTLIGLFFISQRIFSYLYGLILPYERKTKILRRFYQKYIWLKEKILTFNLSIGKLFILNLLITITITILYLTQLIKFDPKNLISFDGLLQTNATIFALILTITVAILGNNRYLRKIQITKVLFSGLNLAFFLLYILLIILCFAYPTDALFILSVFMLGNSFIFMINFIDNQKIGYIINILNKIIFENINNKNFNPNVSSTRNKFSWNIVKGAKIESGSFDKFEDFKNAFDSLEDIVVESHKNNDRRIFIDVIRNYFELGRYFLYRCKDNDKKVYLGVYLSPILRIYNQINDKEYRLLIVEEILNDYRCSEQFLDIKTWNLERFKLMISILKGISEKKEREFILSILIKMLTIRMMEKMQITYNNFSNQSYKQFKNSEEFKELKVAIKKYKIIWKEIAKLMKSFRFQDEKEQKEFNKSTKDIIAKLKKK